MHGADTSLQETVTYISWVYDMDEDELNYCRSLTEL